jgi:hypothetical protein
MMILIAAAALAAQVPTAPANPHPMQMGGASEHRAMDCCKDCCKDKAAKHDGHGSKHAGHSNQ